MKYPVGAQVWSLRKLLSADAQGVLMQLSEAGYSFIEPSGFDPDTHTMQGFKPEALRALADEQQLSIKSGHFPPDLMAIERICAYAVAAGMAFIVCSFFEKEVPCTAEAYKNAAVLLNNLGAKVKSCQLQLLYHNHAHEFKQVNDTTLYDLLMAHTNPDLVSFQPDLGWMAYAGQDPVALFDKYGSRFPVWHVRDIDAVTGETTTIGKGRIDFKDIYTAHEMAGLQYAIVEMASGTEDPLGKILDSMAYIKAHVC